MYQAKILLFSAFLAGMFTVSTLQADSCGSTASNRQKASSTQKNNNPVQSSKLRNLRKKQSKDLKTLKRIHDQQLIFLKQYNGTTSKVTANDRDTLKAMIEELPATVKKSDMLFIDQMAFIEYTVYAIMAGKEKYKSKKNFTDPELLLKDIQKKQRNHMMKLQKLDQKRIKP